jgi:hypothetical protein
LASQRRLISDGTLLASKIAPRRGGRAVDRAGLEIRIQDFGLNWTAFTSSALVFDEFTFLVRVNWTGAVGSALNFFQRVTFAGYSPATFAYAYIWPISVQVTLHARIFGENSIQFGETLEKVRMASQIKTHLALLASLWQPR